MKDGDSHEIEFISSFMLWEPVKFLNEVDRNLLIR